ncbi:MAG: ABC transporter permease, partial [Oceanibaculum sp.]
MIAAAFSFRNKRANALIGGALMAVILGAAALALVWTPFDPLGINLRARFAAPSPTHLFGADEFGRDVLSRAMAGALSSTSISFLTVSFAVICGTAIGVVTGYVRGWTDRAIMTVNDALLAFPGMLLALGLMAVIGPNRYGIILALGIAYTPSVVRVVRGTVMSIREREYVEASRVLGNGELYTMARHVLPN